MGRHPTVAGFASGFDSDRHAPLNTAAATNETFNKFANMKSF